MIEKTGSRFLVLLQRNIFIFYILNEFNFYVAIIHNSVASRHAVHGILQIVLIKVNINNKL